MCFFFFAIGNVNVEVRTYVSVIPSICIIRDGLELCLRGTPSYVQFVLDLAVSQGEPMGSEELSCSSFLFIFVVCNQLRMFM
jgi:hypothetical protein